MQVGGGFGGTGEEPEEKSAEEAKHTRIRVEQSDNLVTFSLDPVLDNMAYNRLVRSTELPVIVRSIVNCQSPKYGARPALGL